MKRKHPKEFEYYMKLKPAHELQVGKKIKSLKSKLDVHVHSRNVTRVMKTDWPLSITHNYIVKELPKTRTERIEIACKYCGKMIKGSIQITSNFLTHIKVEF